MALSDRIEKLKPYLLVYNVSIEDGVQYAVLRIPEKWSIPTEEIDKAYGVKVRKIDGGICFLADIEAGQDSLFDSLDYVISLNIKLEERVSLLKQKVDELKEIFMKEDLEKLRTIEFVFPPQKNTKNGGARKKTKPQQQNVAATEIKKEQKPVPVEADEKPTEENGNGLMDFVENSIAQ